MTAEVPVRCVRCEQSAAEPIGFAPFPNDLGERIGREICAPCWEEWKKQQMLLINHYGLNVRDRGARDFLISNLREFLFGEEAERPETEEAPATDREPGAGLSRPPG